MATEKESAERAVAEAFRRNLDVGLFTHGIAAFGGLTRDGTCFLHAHLPGHLEVFDLASLTKALVTVPLVFRAVVREGLSLDSQIGVWLGPVASADLDPRLCGLTVRSLLQHRSGLPAWRNFWICEPGLVRGLNRAADGIRQDNSDVYSDVGFLLLGLALERNGKASLAELFEAMCRTELGLDAAALPLAYGPRLKTIENVVPTSLCALRGRLLQGEVHDENCGSLGGITGHAGLFGTAASVSRYLCALYTSPVGKALWDANCKARVLPPGDPPNESLMGWRQGAIKSAVTFREGRAIGHLGFTGTALWIDPERAEWALLFTNRVCNGRIRPEIVSFRRDVFAAMNALRA